MLPRDYWRFERNPDALAALDGLRAVAIILVLWRHGLYPFMHAAGLERLLPVGGYDLAAPLINGWIGVDLFFVLSGFLIARQLLNLQERQGGLRYGPYILRRMLRILPTYVFVLLLAAAGLIPFYPMDSAALGFRVTYHLLLLQDYLASDIVTPFWSLAVEEKFYLLAPVILGSAFAVRGLRARMILVVAAILLAILLRVGTALRVDSGIGYELFFRLFRQPFHACLDALALGMLAALLHRQAMAAAASRLRRHASALFWSGLALLLLLAAPGDLMAHIGWWDETLQPTCIAAGFTALLLGAALGGGPQRALGAHWLLVIARLSYPLYLIHMTLIPLAWWLAGATPEQGDLEALLRFLPIYFGLSGLAAAAIHFAVEKPFLIFKARLEPVQALATART